MAGLDVPLDIMIEVGPPESVKEVAPDGEYSLMAKGVVGLSDQFEAAAFRNVSLVFAVSVVAPEPVVEDEEFHRIFGEPGEIGF